MNPTHLNKYFYIEKTPTWMVRTLYSVGILTWFGVIYGYSLFYVADKVVFFIVAPFIGFLIVYHFLSYAITLFYKQFDLEKHFSLLKNYDIKELSSDKKSFPLVDIFLPICGENSEVLQKTFHAVSQLNYPNKKVYVLDDKGVAEHQFFAQEHGFTYLSRENKGHMKKAGNLKHGYERSMGDFIGIYDADFAPHPDFVTELLPYMSDPHIGIIQSPQYFQTDEEVYRRSWLEYGASHTQEDFYRFIQVARSRLGAPICCGSNAIYRRNALNSIGGTVQIEHSEDAYTGFELLTKGWKVKFIPIILAVGLCPSDIHSYFHQQHRWASGSLSLMLSKKFWTANITIAQKLCFISGFMYYLSHPVMIVFSFQIFLLLFYFHEYINLWNSLPFLPVILFAFFVIPFFRLTRSRIGGFLARNAYLYSYGHATVVALLRKSVGWQPAGAKRQTVSKAYMEQLSFVAVYFLIYTTLVAYFLGAGIIDIFDINQYPLLFWVFYNIISTVFILFHFYFVLDDAKQKEFSTSGGASSFIAWRINTFGVYLVIFSSFFFVAFTLSFDGSSVYVATPAVFEEVSSSRPPLFVVDRYMNDEAVDILALQQFLNARGFALRATGFGSQGNETSYFGRYTQLALLRFQRANNIPERGYLGPLTRRLINENQ